MFYWEHGGNMTNLKIYSISSNTRRREGAKHNIELFHKLKKERRKQIHINLSPHKFLIIPINRIIFSGDNIICISLTHERISFTENFYFFISREIN